MFKKRLMEAAFNIIAALIVLVIIVIVVGLVYLTSLINKELPGIIGAVIVFGMLALYVGTMLYEWIKWQFVDPYKESKKNKR